MLLERLHLLLIDLGLLEVHRLGSGNHLGLVMLDYIASAASQEFYNFLDIVIVFLLRDAAGTAAKAFLDMEVETWPYLVSKDDIGCYGMSACAQRICVVEEFHEIAGMDDAPEASFFDMMLETISGRDSTVPVTSRRAYSFLSAGARSPL